MGGLVSNLILPIKAAYIRLFEINKYFAVFVLSVSTTVLLFVLMVTLISLGDSGLKEDKSVKLADIVMPEREIDTFMDEVDKPDEPEEQPEFRLLFRFIWLINFIHKCIYLSFRHNNVCQFH